MVEKAEVPDSDPVASPSGAVVYQRNFNVPTGLQAGDRVFVNFERFEASRATVELNAQLLMETSCDAVRFPLRLDVTEQLAASNRLTVCLQPAADRSASINGDVSLQIESA